MNKQNYEYLLKLECATLKMKLDSIKNRNIKVIKVCRDKTIYIIK